MIPADDLQAAVLLDYSSQPDLPWDQRGSARSEAQKSEVALSGVNAHTCILASMRHVCIRPIATRRFTPNQSRAFLSVFKRLNANLSTV